MPIGRSCVMTNRSCYDSLIVRVSNGLHIFWSTMMLSSKRICCTGIGVFYISVQKSRIAERTCLVWCTQWTISSLYNFHCCSHLQSICRLNLFWWVAPSWVYHWIIETTLSAICTMHCQVTHPMTSRKLSDLVNSREPNALGLPLRRVLTSVLPPTWLRCFNTSLIVIPLPYSVSKPVETEHFTPV